MIEDFKYLRLKEYFKSEDVPQENNGRIKKLVSRNFKETVKNAEKELLIYFYSDDCTHCSDFREILEGVVDLIDENKVEVYNVDEAKNSIEGVFIDRVPALIFFTPDNKENFERFDMTDRSHNKLLEWLESVSKQNLFVSNEL